MEKVIFESHFSKRPVNCEYISGFENFSDLIYIEQPTQGKGSNANAGSMLGMADVISKIFADTEESKKRKFRSSHFISGSREARCLICEGAGSIKVSMDFFSDVHSVCEHCGGTGFNDETLEIKVDDKTIFDVLQITFSNLSCFINTHIKGKSVTQSKIILELLEKTGLGHLSSGRSLKTLSAGELQRLKLVTGLSLSKSNNILFLLDEPTGGLHPKDILKIVKLFNEIIDAGNTIICVTHEPMLIDNASHVIELGPGGGPKGGRIIS